MSKQESDSLSFTNDSKPVFRRCSPVFVGALAAVGIVLAGCATAGEKGYPASPRPGDAGGVPAFGAGTAKELSFSDKRVTLVFAVDENGKVQAFRAPGARAFTVRDLVAQPLKADFIEGFESCAIFKSKNPKICWPDRGGSTSCVEWPD